MPYIVTTKRPVTKPVRKGRIPGHIGSGRMQAGRPEQILSRVAVATLEESREAAREACLYVPGSIEAIGQAIRDAFALPEAGGTVGPLPDGSLIEVERVIWGDLADRADCYPVPWSRERILAAFNEANR